MKYIDADKLIAEIDKILAKAEKDEKKALYKKDANGHLIAVTKTAICVSVKKIITSLKLEQPNKYETALGKAREWMPNVNQGGHAILIAIFPELGEGLDPRYGGGKQEQPEVDIKKELHAYICSDEYMNTREDGSLLIARHFYELGLKARKEG